MKSIAHPEISMKKRSRSSIAGTTSLVEHLESRQLMSVSLPLGGVVNQEIRSAGEVDTYTFSAPQASTFELNTDSDKIDTGFSAKFTLYAPNGGQVGYWFNHTSRRLENLAAGQYTLTVNDNSRKNRGDYQVGLEGLSPISPNPVSLPRGGVIAGSIDSVLDVKQYVFSVANGTTAQLDTSSAKIDTGFSAKFTLYRDGAQLDYWFNNSSRRLQNLPAGQYMLKVNDNSYENRGQFSAGLELLNQPFSPDARPLANNTLTAGSIGGVLDVKQYTFLATAPTMQFATTGSAIDIGFSAKFSLYDANGALLRYWFNRSNITQTNLTPNAYYMLQIQDNSLAHRGTFTVSAQGLSPVSFAPSIKSLTAFAPPAQFLQLATLTANTVTDRANDVKAVYFFEESNGVAGLQSGTGGDLLIGTDSSSLGGYSAVLDTSTLIRGQTYTLYAQAIDANDALGNIVTASIRVQ